MEQNVRIDHHGSNRMVDHGIDFWKKVFVDSCIVLIYKYIQQKFTPRHVWMSAAGAYTRCVMLRLNLHKFT